MCKGELNLSKYKFKSTKKNKFHIFKDADETIDSNIYGDVHTEIFLNKKIIIEGCQSIVDYKNDYIKLKIKKGFLNIFGNDFIITSFDNEKIVVKGNIASIEFCV